MKTIDLKRIAAGIVFAILVQAISTSAAGLTVEQVQRDYQIRYKAVTGSYLTWPECKSSSGTPAPAYPKDGFYGDLSTDPDKAVMVVQDLVQKFYTDDKIFDKFLNITDFSQIEGASSLPVFPDEQPPSSVTAANYSDVLQQIESELSKMKFFKAITWQISYSWVDSKVTLTEDQTASDAEACLESHHGLTPWGGALFYSMCSDPPSNLGKHPDLTYVISASGTGIPWFSSAYRAILWNMRGYVNADLRDFSRGKNAELFLMYSAPEIDGNLLGEMGCFSSTSTYRAPATKPTSAPMSTYGVWPAEVPTLGENWNSDPIPGSDEIQQQFGNFASGNLDMEGWEVKDAVVIVDMEDFTTTPDPQDCCSCTTQCKPSGTTCDLNSIHVNIGLGSDNYGGSAGALSINADLPNTTLSTLQGLRYSVADTVQVMGSTGSGHIQFKTSQALVDAKTDNSYQYTISFYNSANWGSIGGDGFYAPSGSASTTIVVANPDGATAYNRLQVTRTDAGGTPSVTLYSYTASSGTWTMTTGAGSETRNESRSSSWDNTHTIRTETHTITDSGNNVIYNEVNTYQLFAWGEEMIQQVVDPNGANLTSTWHYYTDPNSSGYGQVMDYTDANGHWTQYQYDSDNRETKEIIQFGNSPFGSAESANRAISTTYSTSDPEITTVETLLGQEISRKYQVVHSDEVDDIVCQTGGAARNASDNLVTITKRYTTGTFTGEPSSILHPDGTMEFYTYVIDSGSGTRTDTVDSGEPDSGKTMIIDGTRTVTIKGSVGQMISRTVWDIATGITLESETYSDYDEFNRPQKVTYLDGTESDTTYGCCGVDTTTDKDGVMTEYLYDSLNRQYGYVRNGIMTENIMDPAGNVVMERRTGTDSSQIVMHTAVYDHAGRTSSETNALNGATVYADTFSSGERVHTATYADGGTRIETYNEDGSLASVTGTAVFPVRYEYGVEQDGTVWRSYTKEIKLNLNGTDSSEWTKTYTDMAGRTYKTVFAAAGTPYPYTQNFYNNLGQLWKQQDADGVVTLFQYNAKGEQEYTALDVNQNDTIDFSGSDRISRTVRSVVAAAGSMPNLIQVDNYVWKDGQSTGTLVGRSQTSTDGLKTWTTAYRDVSTPVTSSSVTAYNGTTHIRTVTETMPDNSYSISAFTSGQLTSVTRYDSTTAQIGQTTYTYDAHGRQNTDVDARNGATIYGYNNADLITSTTTPAPGNGDPAQTMLTYYNKMLEATNTVNPDGTRVTNLYFLTGTLQKTFGSRTYPVAYTYDYAGRVATMETWKNYAGNSGTAITTWNYDPYRGWLANKRYADNTGPDYTYTSGGRLQTRTWARTGTGAQRIITTYTYGFNDGISGNEYGNLVQVAYANDPQNTPSATYTYDRLGRQSTLTQNGMTETLGYNDANQLLTDAFSGGTLDGLTVTSGYDTYSRRQTVSVNTQPSVLTTTYGYDNASRLATASDGHNNSAAYTYVVNSPLVSQISFKQNGTTRMTTTKSYDNLNRLTQIQSSAGGLMVAPFAYTYNSANQRIQRTEAQSSHWVYEYDSLGQVKSATKYWADWTPVAGQQFVYAFDDIGNRTSTQTGGDDTGNNLRLANYTVNSVNQYTRRDVPSFLDILGIALPTETVTVNSQSTYRKGEYFRKELSIGNHGAAVWQSVAVAATGETTVNGNKFVPSTQEQFTYDLDGNLTQDGRWNYTWDAENRLIEIESLTSNPTASKRRVVWQYDCQGRRIRQTTYDGSSGSYVITEDLKFVNDGWNLIAELAAANNAVVRSYVWGSDLSGSMQGAGGVGGLLEVNYTGTATTNAFVAFDGNGNVAALVNAADESTVAQYEYGPFGEMLRATGPMANLNPIRFSTKRTDDTSSFVLYEYRFYNPSSGKWLSRDPIYEAGGADVYESAWNNAINFIDDNGRQIFLATPLEAATQTTIDIGTKVIVDGGGATSTGNTLVPDTLSPTTTSTSPLGGTAPTQGPNLMPPVPVLAPQPQTKPNSKGKPDPNQPNNPQSKTHRGRIQAQGCGLEKSVAWAQAFAPSVEDGLDMVTRLEGQLSRGQLKVRVELFAKARAWIIAAGQAGGVNAPASKSWNISGTTVRVDIEIRTGRAFVIYY